MTSETYQILYCSRNCMHGTVDEIAAQVSTILASSRRNNATCGVTGALIFNSVFFAQVLEGPLAGIEKTFERIQRDSRHSDLMVLKSGLVEGRDFPVWSMAFAGADSAASNPFLAATLDAASSNPTEAGNDVLALLRGLVLQEEAWALPTQRSSIPLPA